MAVRTIANIAVGFIAKTDGFSKGVAKVKKETASIGKGIGKAGLAAGAGALAGLGAGFGALLGSVDTQRIDRIGKLSKITAVSAKELESWNLAAELGGTNLETLVKGSSILQQRFVQAAGGSARLRAIFKMLNIDYQNLQDDPAEALSRVATALGQVENKGLRAGLQLEIFGARNRDLIAVFAEGGDPIKEATEFLDQFGGALGKEDTARFETFNDNLTKLGIGFRTLGENLATKFTIGPLLDFSEMAIEALAAVSQFILADNFWGRVLGAGENLLVSAFGQSVDFLEMIFGPGIRDSIVSGIDLMMQVSDFLFNNEFWNRIVSGGAEFLANPFGAVQNFSDFVLGRGGSETTASNSKEMAKVEDPENVKHTVLLETIAGNISGAFNLGYAS